MVIFGVGQGLGLSALTTGGMAGVAPRDAGVAGGLVNVAHHLGGALGLGHPRHRLRRRRLRAATDRKSCWPHRVSAALTAAAAFLALALLVTLATRTAHASPPRPSLTTVARRQQTSPRPTPTPLARTAA